MSVKFDELSGYNELRSEEYTSNLFHEKTRRPPDPC